MNPRRATVVLLVLAAAAACGLSPAAARAASQGVYLSFFHPVAVGGGPDASANAAFSLLYGEIGEVHGFGLALGASRVSRADGLLLSGLYSQAQEEFVGAAVTGVLNYFEGDGRGAQLAGIANFHRGEWSGLQMATFVNFSSEGTHGAQVSGLFNLNDGETWALQISGFGNGTAGELRGAQVAGGYNFAIGDVHGAQVALLNAAGDVEGAQLGLANFSREMRGLTVGLVNSTQMHHGVPIGAVNLSRRNGSVDLALYGSSLSLVNAGVRTSVNRFTSVLALGYGDPEGDVDVTAVLSWHPGYEFWRRGPWSATAELGFLHYMPEASSDPDENDRLHFALEARAQLERRFSDRLAAFLGAGVGRWYDRYDGDPQGRTKAAFHGGVAIF